MQTSILLTNVYFPYYSRHDSYSYDLSLITSYIESVCNRYSSMKYVIAGDFNFECTTASSGYHMCSELFSNNNLICCDNMLVDRTIEYTYIHESLGHRSWLDHIFISESLSSCIYDFKILDDGINCSDHLPIVCTFKLDLTNSIEINAPQYDQPKRLRWDKADLISYYYLSGQLLQPIDIPSNILQCSAACNSTDHCTMIDNYYHVIINALDKSAA